MVDGVLQDHENKKAALKLSGFFIVG